VRDVLVVGAGWAGLTAAARLAAKGYAVTVVEKSRGPGGRSATRRAGRFEFDHGAQYLTASSDAFARQVKAWAAAGLLASWDAGIAVFGRPPDASSSGAGARRWVGTPSMNAVPRRLAEGLDCRWRWRAERLAWDGTGWAVTSGEGERLEARSLLLTAPPAQSLGLLGDDHALAGSLSDVEMAPCWALMVGYERAPEIGFDAAFVNQGPLSWVARMDTRPGRQGAPSWIAHAGPAWSRTQLEAEPERVASLLLAALGELDVLFTRDVRLLKAHRWRYARGGVSSLSPPLLSRARERLVVAGDWCAGERIEGAWISGVAAARRLERLL